MYLTAYGDIIHFKITLAMYLLCHLDMWFRREVPRNMHEGENLETSILTVTATQDQKESGSPKNDTENTEKMAITRIHALACLSLMYPNRKDCRKTR